MILLAGACSLIVGLYALRSPTVAAIVLLILISLRRTLNASVPTPIEMWWFVFALLVAATVLWMDRTQDRLRGVGAIECAMAVYLLWNVYSMVAPHKYPAVDILGGQPLTVGRFIIIGILLPFVFYLVGRYTFDRPAAVRALLWFIVAFATYSAAVSIMPSIGLSDVVWPRYIVTEVPAGWTGRAIGILGQPVVNGMVLALGFAVAMFFAGLRSEPRYRRCAMVVIAAACGWGIYLTHTRAAWASAAVVLILGALLANDNRRGFIAALGLVSAGIALNWSTFTSPDRSAGGVASASEVNDRLNAIQTSLWAFEREPLVGWGIARFQSINTYHHQQWSLDTPWLRGLGEVSHENELGILAELGVIGLATWICVLGFIAHRLWKAYRTLPSDDLCGRPLAVISIMGFAVLVCTGLTVDLRFFDYPTAVIFLLAGTTIGWWERAGRRGVAPVVDTPARPVMSHG
ncbi:O-antigen ligase family protein [Mycobacterium sp. AMU20-3851]|uniref:O-antigen ligase family protein n=1 Tax=Mycobacterium sp. AMU20-3851 TaxID=3122055 RepID=UPI003753EF33